MHKLGFNQSDCIFLKPGDFWFGRPPATLYTILGSCIAITLWHPQLKVGGMCHYLLPGMEMPRPAAGNASQGRTAGEAMALFLASVRRYGTLPSDYQVKLFGGASFFQDPLEQRVAGQVAARNVIAARALLKQEGFHVLREHVGGQASRKLILDLSSGDTWLQMISSL